MWSLFNYTLLSYITVRSNGNFRQGFVGLTLTNSIFFCEITASCYLAPNITASNLLNLLN